VSWTLPCDVLCLGLANGGRNISRSLKLLCLKRNIGNLSAVQEKSGYLLRQRGNERFVGNPEVRVGPSLSSECAVTRGQSPGMSTNQICGPSRFLVRWTIRISTLLLDRRAWLTIC
jgi:hypothetical protein